MCITLEPLLRFLVPWSLTVCSAGLFLNQHINRKCYKLPPPLVASLPHYIAQIISNQINLPDYPLNSASPFGQLFICHKFVALVSAITGFIQTETSILQPMFNKSSVTWLSLSLSLSLSLLPRLSQCDNSIFFRQPCTFSPNNYILFYNDYSVPAESVFLKKLGFGFG